jgi:hypothetical protein
VKIFCKNILHCEDVVVVGVVIGVVVASVVSVLVKLFMQRLHPPRE